MKSFKNEISFTVPRDEWDKFWHVTDRFYSPFLHEMGFLITTFNYAHDVKVLVRRILPEDEIARLEEIKRKRLNDIEELDKQIENIKNEI